MEQEVQTLLETVDKLNALFRSLHSAGVMLKFSVDDVGPSAPLVGKLIVATYYRDLLKPSNDNTE